MGFEIPQEKPGAFDIEEGKQLETHFDDGYQVVHTGPRESGYCKRDGDDRMYGACDCARPDPSDGF